MVCRPAPDTESSGTWPPLVCAGPRFLAPSTKDALVSPPSPPLSLQKHLQLKGIAVHDPQRGLRHKLGEFSRLAAGVPKDSCAAGLRARSNGPEGGSRRSPLTGTTPCLRRCNRVCPWVSVCRRAGLREEKGQKVAGGGRRQLFGLQCASGESRSLQNRCDFYWKPRDSGAFSPPLPFAPQSSWKPSVDL